MQRDGEIETRRQRESDRDQTRCGTRPSAREQLGVRQDAVVRLDGDRRRAAATAARSSQDSTAARLASLSAVNWTSAGDYEDIRYELSGDGIAKITINRPEVRNAFRPETLIEVSRRAREGARGHARSA